MNPENQTPEEGTEIEEVVTPQADQEQETPETPTVENLPEGEGENETTPPQQPDPKPDVDYKQKFVDSQREAILLNERNKIKDSRIEQLTKQDTPTDEAMRSLYPDWDTFNDVAKKAYLRIEAQNLKQARLEAQQEEILSRQRLDDQLEDLIDDPKFAKLKGKEAEFKRFAKKKENLGLSAEVVAKAFLFDASDDEVPEHKPTITPGLERGNGGPRTAPKPKKISLEEASNLRKTNWKEYKRLSDAGMIEELE